MTCTHCNDRGLIPDRRLHAGRFIDCPHCEPMTDPVEEYRAIAAFLFVSALVVVAVALVVML